MDVDANKVCGMCLARLREAAGLTQICLSEKLGVPQSFVSKIETGERSLKAYELFAYAQALGLDTVNLVQTLQEDLDRAGLLDASPGTLFRGVRIQRTQRKRPVLKNR